jgi:DNA-directed RNA polymerase specialized sigma24 family protein
MPDTDRTQEFLELLTHHDRALGVYVYSMVPQLHDADDILQQTKMILWRCFDQFETGTNFLAWARKTAFHQVLTHRRQKKREATPLSDEILELLHDEVSKLSDSGDRRRDALENLCDEAARRASPARDAALLRGSGDRWRGGAHSQHRGGSLPRPEPHSHEPHDLRGKRTQTGRSRSMKPADQFRLLELSERYADEKLSAEEVSALEAELRDNAEARAFFAKALHQRAELCFDDSWHTQAAAEVKPTARPMWWRQAITAAAAACVTFGLFWLQSTRDGTVATLIRAQQCQWAGSSLPTVEGARLKPGVLDLIEGLAVLRFDSGAELALEAPATVEVLDAMNCKLRRGTLVAEVPPQAKGFSIDTKDAKVIDWGTKFGLSAGEDGKYMVQVLEGLVEVEDKTGGASKKLEKGQRVDRGWSKSLLNPSSGDGP